ncbi:serine/threonine-protein kinase [Arthrobacter psychrochitiniphilus]|uniref:serine/threonine-protein kinase n=1 Tax=Arthrobacter psychrochitiniphilus TaxID=291045 RepID=UPI003F7B9DD7
MKGLTRLMLPEVYDLKDVMHATVNSRVCLVERGGLEFVAKLPPLGHEKAARRFAREINALKKAAGRHTIPVVDFADDFSWYVMPRAEGDLNSFKVPMEAHSVLAVLEAIAESLRSLHAAGEVHRDLKPANVLRLKDALGERWVVADFGIVRNPSGETTADLTRTGQFLGTDGWAAPEQSKDAHGVTPAADVYSAGLIAAWMLTGLHPNDGAAASLSSAPMSNAIYRAISERASRRHQSMDDFIATCRKELGAKTPSTATLIAQRKFAEILPANLTQPGLRDQSLDAIAAMTIDDRAMWFKVDKMGLEEVLTKTIEGLVDDHNLISFSATVDPILIHGVEVLILLAADWDQSARRFAVTVFGAISDIHQFAPASRVLDRLDTLPALLQPPIREALHEAGAWDFFANMASNRFPVRRTSPLLIELAGH